MNIYNQSFTRLIGFCWIIVFLYPSLVFSQDNIDTLSVTSKTKGLFDTFEILEITLITDFSDMIKEIRDDSDTLYHKAVAIYKTENGTYDTVKCEIKPRGNYRRNPEHCAFPPLFVKFSKKKSVGTPFEGLKKLKLVTHCSNTNKVYEQYVLREYLVYRTYNVITDSSFHVRLAKVTYIDTENKKESMTKFAFFIENDNQMANRMGGDIIKVKNIHQDRTNYDLIGKMSLFEYLVGNPDWSVSLLHNIKIVQTSPFELPIAVPYDFDYCGVINTSYAAPSQELNIGSVTERIYRGFCREESEFEKLFTFFESKKQEIYDIYYNLEPLNEKSLNWSIKYYDKFYETINDPKEVKKEFLNACWESRKE